MPVIVQQQQQQPTTTATSTTHRSVGWKVDPAGEIRHPAAVGKAPEKGDVALSRGEMDCAWAVHLAGAEVVVHAQRSVGVYHVQRWRHHPKLTASSSPVKLQRRKARE